MNERAVLVRPPAASSGNLRAGSGEPNAARGLAGFVFLGAVAVLLGNWDSLQAFLSAHLEAMVLWAAILIAVNLFPVRVAEMTLTLDLPILLAIAILYPPEVAASIALLTGLDIREFSGEISPTRAVFNRGQISLAVFLAAVAFRSVAPQLDPWSVALGAAILALLAFHLTNVLLVSCFTAIRTGRSIGMVLRQMIVGDWREFVPSYLSLGALAVLLAFLHSNLGAWSVILFLAPLLVARQALVREQRLQTATRHLRERERLLQRMFDRMADERKDERTRIAYDLHDDVMGSLVRISQLGRFIQQSLEPPAQLENDLEELSRLSSVAGEKVRQVVRGLELSGIGRGGLVTTLSGFVKELETRCRTKINFDVLLTSPLPSGVELCAYQIAKEALENAVRYSSAKQIRVRLTQQGQELHLSISDDGVGFCPNEVDRSSHFGLGLLEARAHVAGGVLRVVSSPGRGTAVTAVLPIEKKRPEELAFSSPGPRDSLL